MDRGCGKRIVGWVEGQDGAAKWAEFALTMTVNFDELRLLMMPDKRLGMSSHRDCILHLQLPRSLFALPIHQIPPPSLPPLDGRDASYYLRFGPN